MQSHEAALIRYVVQHKLHLEDEQFRARFLELFDLDEDHDTDAIMAIEQFANDIACHVLERLVVSGKLPSEMFNHEVARCFVNNAIAYGKSGDLETVMHNLDFVHSLLLRPNDINQEYDWSDFK